ncbi:hemin uptake protein HemP [Roseibium sp. RKSG952]|uniref:hemin uptake protein HemP n=1 Tax=Roseibium sp. RKSG952 TaxID=2529384 RepID=UPI0012BC4467|nr:hemin uptake protein HemP [Roseibium sp. RKSG952]MTH95457.1 hemin uptake protein HemP [Roseibium sp. RKSG952]
MQTSNFRRARLSLPTRPAAAPALMSCPADEAGGADLDTRRLFKGRRELTIKHNDETYRLTITKLGKLILTK